MKEGSVENSGIRKQFCTFYVGDLYFGVDVNRVQEVVRDSELTPVPRAPGAVAGLVNLRGQIVTVVDLRARLGLPLLDADCRSKNIVVCGGNESVSFLVDRVGEVIGVEDGSFEVPPANLRGVARDLILGVYKLPEALLHVLHMENALNVYPPPMEMSGNAHQN